MRGEILSFDDGAGTGLISGDDGIRYAFDRSAVSPPSAIRSGLRVDFVPEDGHATQVMLLAGAAPAAGLAAGVTPNGSIDFQSLLFSFQGRTRRSHFWIAWLLIFAASIVLGWIPLLGILVSLLLIWPNLAITVKRLHDMGLSGWLAAVPYVVGLVGSVLAFGMIGMSAVANANGIDSDDPAAVLALLGPAFGLFGIMFLVGIGFLLWIGLTDSKPGDNKYGPNPKGF